MTKILANILTAIALSALFALCVSFVAIRVLGLSTYIVTGGSMEPSIHKGSLVLVQPTSPSQVNLGDVITFQQYGQTTTHRVITIGRGSTGLLFKTKGDANTVADPEDKTFSAQVGVVRLAVPAAGYAASQVQAYWRLVLTLIAAITFFACAGVLLLKKDTSVALAPARPPRLIRRPNAVVVDPDEAWSAHLAWTRAHSSMTSQQRRGQAA